jgi:hypothetical protein
MQLNVYVPNDQAEVVERLDQAVLRLGRNKNELVLEAIREKLARLESELRRGRPAFRSYAIGAGTFDRGELYSERLDR